MTIDANSPPDALPTLLLLSTLAVPIPASADGHTAADTLLADVGLVIATPANTGCSHRERHIGAVAAGTGEGVLLEWLLPLPPVSATLVGWRLADAILPSLLSAAADDAPQLGHAILKALARAVSGPAGVWRSRPRSTLLHAGPRSPPSPRPPGESSPTLTGSGTPMDSSVCSRTSSRRSGRCGASASHERPSRSSRSSARGRLLAHREPVARSPFHPHA